MDIPMSTTWKEAFTHGLKKICRPYLKSEEFGVGQVFVRNKNPMKFIMTNINYGMNVITK